MGRARIQIPKTEDADQVNPQPPLHLERPDDKDGKHGKEYVGGNVERRVDQPKNNKQLHGVALWFERKVPVAGHWRAVEEQRHHRGDGIADNNNWQNVVLAAMIEATQMDAHTHRHSQTPSIPLAGAESQEIEADREFQKRQGACRRHNRLPETSVSKSNEVVFG